MNAYDGFIFCTVTFINNASAILCIILHHSQLTKVDHFEPRIRPWTTWIPIPRRWESGKMSASTGKIKCGIFFCLFVCVFIYAYIYIYIYTYIHSYIYKYTQTYIHIYAYIYKYIYDGLSKCLFLVWLINRNSLRAASCLVFKTMTCENRLKPCILMHFIFHVWSRS